jgi:phage tail-like protein
MPEEIQEAPSLPSHYFSIELDEDPMPSPQGDESGGETHVVEYRHGNSPVFYPIKMPGLGRVGNVVMRKGIFAGDDKFWTWYNEIKLNTRNRKTVVINLLDETGAPAMICTLHNAWPTKGEGTNLKSEGNEVAIESVEIAFETMTVSTP